MSSCGCEPSGTAEIQRRTLRTLLAINALMFCGEFVAGWLAQSTGLLADSLDMLADASVYGIALYAVGRAGSSQIRAASLSGALQVVLGIGVLLEVIRRLVFGSDPASLFMIGVGVIALAANIVCLLLIAEHRDGEIHMRASWIFSANDVIANAGVIVSGALVMLFGSRLPDLVVGAVISVIVTRGGLRILREAREAARDTVSV